ncbi:F-box protein At2g26160-like [Prunus avium]|uniref:F-box protein At2g26160-like n=1 Tax=Prunus avium TaxID=42229 RepID=A0A6P5T8E5_PRUAV|nr:F-box protein At2g26160-like [Prunus avium]
MKNQKSCCGFGSMNSDWSNLPKELLYLVLERLESPLEFRLVCKPWRSAAKNTKTTKMFTPLILISEPKKDIWNAYNVVVDKVLKLQLKLQNQRFCGSSKGWLIAVDENSVVSLINPFLGVGRKREKENSVIRLPPLSTPNRRRNFYLKRRYDHLIYKATISADPILDPNNCIILVIYEELSQLAFIRLNRDKKWTYADKSVDQSWRLIEEVVQFQDKFYALDRLGKLCSFDITTQSILNVNLVAHGAQHDRGYDYKRYLVVSNENKILMVEKCFVYIPPIRFTRKFRIFELNFKMGEWVEKNTLGDAALFVGDSSSICVLASKLGCRPNCIYFNHDNNRTADDFSYYGPHDYGVYNMEKKSVLKPYTEDAKILLKKSRQPSIWVVPSCVM